MTEAEWLNGDDLQAKVEYLGPDYSFRKSRLFAAACARLMPAFSTRPLAIRAVEALERVAEDPDAVDPDELHQIFLRAAEYISTEIMAPDEFAARAVQVSLTHPAGSLMLGTATLTAQTAGFGLSPPAGYPDPAERMRLISEAMDRSLPLFHDVVGNPFRPVSWDPTWRTADVLGVARGIYEDRAFDRLPILADALMDAGCADDQVLGHCRSSGPHVRGCWVVDLALGKT